MGLLEGQTIIEEIVLDRIDLCALRIIGLDLVQHRVHPVAQKTIRSLGTHFAASRETGEQRNGGNDAYSNYNSLFHLASPSAEAAGATTADRWYELRL